jgi:ligand-binding sensor domain-containing protein/signal transduction histidine kinase
MISLPVSGIAQSFFFNHYDQESGLIDTEINCITQDSNGFLWIGSNGGLTRYDGMNFEEIEYLHNASNDPVYDLMFDKEGVLWIAGKNGITSYNGSNFNYYSISGIESPFHCYGLAEGVNDDILFFFGVKTLYSLNNGHTTNISHLLEPVNGSIINVTGRQTLDLTVLSSNGEFWHYRQAGFQKVPILNPGIDKAFFASDGKVYAIRSNKLIILDITGDQIITNESIEIQSPEISDVLLFNKGKFFISYEDKVTIVQDNHVTELNRSNGYDGGPVKIIFRDLEENIWFVSRNKGLYCYTGDAIRYLEFSKNQSFTPTSFFIGEDKELFISYFGKGIDMYNGNKVYNINQEKGLLSNYVRWITKSQNDYWMITARGITVIKGNYFRSYTTADGLPHNYCFNACPDPFGRMWVGTEGGVGIYDKNMFEVITQKDGLLSNRIKFMMSQEDGSMLLLSDYGIDLVRNGEILRFVHEGLKNKEVLNTILSDHMGNFWIGSDLNGLIFYDKDTKKTKYLNQSTSLPFTRVRAMVFYKDNWMCVGTERGIFYLEVSSEGSILSIYCAGVEMGYPDFEVNQNAVLKVEDEIYFGTSIGVVIFNPADLHKMNSIPVNITGLMIEFKETDWNSKKENKNTWFGIPVHPVLTYDQNDLQIKFKGVSLKSKDKLWYRYQLLDIDQDWSKPVRNESVLYANLSPGKYKFRVSASYDGINWKESFTQYEFIITPPFWRTWWFYVLLFAFMLVGFVLVNNYRIKTRINQLLLIEKLNKEEYDKIQKKVAMDFHDEVGNHLTSISLLIQLIRNRDWNAPGDLQDLLDKIDIESKNLFHGTKDFTWSIDPKNNNLKEVFYKIKDYGEEVFDNTDIQFQVKNGISEENNITLPAGFTRQIVLIFKEAINNAMKHAGCSKVLFSASIDPEKFMMRLSDDGIGFNTEEIKYYNGLKKMKLRGERIKGDFILISDPKSGTEIILKADLNKNNAS